MLLKRQRLVKEYTAYLECQIERVRLGDIEAIIEAARSFDVSVIAGQPQTQQSRRSLLFLQKAR
jgi:hypothetical protein